MAGAETISVGNAGGYWGDDPHALLRQLRDGPLDYVTQDFLAEITMSILQKQRSRNPELGYARDFLDQLRPCLPLLAASKTRVINNAGGVNPPGCGEAIQRLCREQDVDLPVAVVSGDDLMDRLDELAAGGGLANMETAAPFSPIRDRVQSANVYLGFAPVVEALEQGARLVVTGRVTDTAIAAAPPNWEFGWSADDWDRQAAGVVAGHILECGAQASGGNLTDWERVPTFVDIGYPIAVFRPDGTFDITRHAGSGGLLSLETVLSQLVYEMGDPRRYLAPDVSVDFTSFSVRQTEPDCVSVSGVRGGPAPEQLKVSVSYLDGFKAHGTLLVAGPRAVAKARAVADGFFQRLGIDFEEQRTDLIGFNAAHRHLAPAVDPPEVLLRLGARDPDRGKVAEFSNVFASLILSSVSGVAIVGARPRVQNVVAYWPTLIPADSVTAEVTRLDTGHTVSVPAPARPAAGERQTDFAPAKVPEPPAGGVSTTVPLGRIAYGRSGDKGNTCNIGVVARSEEAWRWICHHLTAETVKAYFGDICRGDVERFEVPNLRALNFLLHESLGGGGTVSLGVDPQGKTYADALLAMPVAVPSSVLTGIARQPIGESS